MNEAPWGLALTPPTISSPTLPPPPPLTQTRGSSGERGVTHLVVAGPTALLSLQRDASSGGVVTCLSSDLSTSDVCSLWAHQAGSDGVGGGFSVTQQAQYACHVQRPLHLLLARLSRADGALKAGGQRLTQLVQQTAAGAARGGRERMDTGGVYAGETKLE
eukprot:CAMPEP_0181175688 /NCGR_PEP_ID=MMETSP1096-20121128/4215_1 /TAXON_ID=156174 ORGANISM="Chrysochromulina ericina, Strain CCMP281" /NCGR_SAMPLE_ID=MMETSP1096 /ASSEMBLY_ACC=CAM_ASM_000453 /LENGTH=160 /DNA_ID=CAMNT_0023263697 /DNA_START=354 /DNA_END=837 /DNA_ORIENTATION=-